MKPLNILFWTLFAVTMGIYATMLFWTLPAIQSEAAGLTPFDMRPGGYSYEEAMMFLLSLSDEGRALYLGPQQTLDLFYPAFLAGTLAFSIAVLVPLTKVWKCLFALVVLPGMLFDYLENGAVRTLLSLQPDEIDSATVAVASDFTILKSVFDSAAFITLAAMLVVWLFRRFYWTKRTH